MDPEEALRQAEYSIQWMEKLLSGRGIGVSGETAGRALDAEAYLISYSDWRARGGFQPEKGDIRAKALLKRLHRHFDQKNLHQMRDEMRELEADENQEYGREVNPAAKKKKKTSSKSVKSSTKKKKKAPSKYTGVLADDMPHLLLEVMVDNVVDDVVAYTGIPISTSKKTEIQKILSAKANAFYYGAGSRELAKLAKKSPNDVRDQLRLYMEHWLAAYLKKNEPAMFKKLPQRYGLSENSLYKNPSSSSSSSLKKRLMR